MQQTDPKMVEDSESSKILAMMLDSIEYVINRNVLSRILMVRDNMTIIEVHSEKLDEMSFEKNSNDPSIAFESG